MSDEKTIEERMAWAAMRSGLIEEVDALRLAKEYARERTEPLVALLRQANRNCVCGDRPPMPRRADGDCWCGAALWNVQLRAALSAEQAQARAQAEEKQ